MFWLMRRPMVISSWRRPPEWRSGWWCVLPSWRDTVFIGPGLPDLRDFATSRPVHPGGAAGQAEPTTEGAAPDTGADSRDCQVERAATAVR